jgi:predicted TPR repeat methyltransferase
VDALAGEAASAAHYDLVVAADVFVYVNDLAPIFAAISRVLAPDGLLAFTVETHAGDGAKLLPTLRYAHSANYLREVLSASGFAAHTLSDAQVRTEAGAPVAGLVAVASRAAAG